MTDREQIGLFSRWLDGTNIELFELSTGEGLIRLRREPGARPVLAEAGTPPSATTIRAPSLGVFRVAHPCRAAPLVQPGQQVEEGDPLGLMQVGSLLVHVVAAHSGTVLEILVEDGTIVGHGAALFRFARGGLP